MAKRSFDELMAVYLKKKPEIEITWLRRKQPKTHDEMFFETGDAITLKLEIARKAAREKRMMENRAAKCGVCTGGMDSGTLQLQRPKSRML